MGFLWEGSTGARAVQLLREREQGTVIQTPELAQLLDVKQTQLHQLLANAVNLRLIKKVRVPGSTFTGWKLGPGNDSANIERRPSRRPAASPAEAARRAEAAQRRIERQAARAAPAPAIGSPPAWPPAFVSAFDPSGGYRVPRIAPEDDSDGLVVDDAPVAPWLRGLLPTEPAPEPDAVVEAPRAPEAPRAQQLPLFDVREIGEPGRVKRAPAPAEPESAVPAAYSNWRQVLLIEAF